MLNARTYNASLNTILHLPSFAMKNTTHKILAFKFVQNSYILKYVDAQFFNIFSSCFSNAGQIGGRQHLVLNDGCKQVYL